MLCHLVFEGASFPSQFFLVEDYPILFELFCVFFFFGNYFLGIIFWELFFSTDEPVFC